MLIIGGIVGIIIMRHAHITRTVLTGYTGAIISMAMFSMSSQKPELVAEPYLRHMIEAYLCLLQMGFFAQFVILRKEGDLTGS